MSLMDTIYDSFTVLNVATLSSLKFNFSWKVSVKRLMEDKKVFAVDATRTIKGGMKDLKFGSGS